VTARYLALGDSYTIGEGVKASERWPAQLTAALRAWGISLHDPVIVARTGWTTSELLHGLDTLPDELPRDFSLVTLLIGVNDQYRRLGTAEFQRGFDQLLERAIQYGGGRRTRVVVPSIPDWSVTPFAADDPRGAGTIATEIEELNRIIRHRALAAGARVVDITTCSRRVEDRALLTEDGLHPSGVMYARWAALILPAAMTAFGS
jgi:lysophospholipase L1-like esterase